MVGGTGNTRLVSGPDPDPAKRADTQSDAGRLCGRTSPGDIHPAEAPQTYPPLSVWRRDVGDRGDVIGVDRCGASASGLVVMREDGCTEEPVCHRALALLERNEV